MDRGNPDIKSYRKDYWTDRVEPKLELIEGWARNGLSNQQIALNLGIGETTFYDFVKQHPELNEVLYKGREDAEIYVENALFKRAVGYSHTETTRERQKVFDEDGKWTGEYKMVLTKKVIKHVVPDVDAQKYWLEHRAPKRWERNPMPGVDANAIVATIANLAQLLKNPVPERSIGCEEDEQL